MALFTFIEDFLFGIVANVVVYSIGAVILIAVYFLFLRLFLFAEKICDRILFFPNLLGKLALDFCKKYYIVPLLLFIPLLVFSVWHIMQSLSAHGIAETIVLGLVEGSTLLQFVNFSFSIQEVLNYPTMIAMGLSSLLSFMFMRCTICTLEATKLPKAVCLLGTFFLNALFLCISSILTERILGWSFAFSAYSNEVIHQVPTLWHSGIYGFADLLQLLRYCFLALAILLAAIFLAVISIREFFATIIYGAFAIGLSIVIGLLVSLLPIFPLWLQAIALFTILFLPDYFRSNDAIKDKIRGRFGKKT